MSFAAHFGPEFGPRLIDWGGPWVLGWLLPLIFSLAAAGLLVWAVLRFSGDRRIGAPPVAAGPPPGGRPDPALEEVRTRYARGEISREDFLRLSADLGRPVIHDPGATPAV